MRVPGAGRRSDLTSTHSAPPVRQCGGCHDHVSGTGLLRHVIECGLAACSCRNGERTRGLATLPFRRGACRAVSSRTASSKSSPAKPRTPSQAGEERDRGEHDFRAIVPAQQAGTAKAADCAQVPADLSFVMTLIVIGGGQRRPSTPYAGDHLSSPPAPAERYSRRHRNVPGHGWQRASSGRGDMPGTV